MSASHPLRSSDSLRPFNPSCSPRYGYLKICGITRLEDALGAAEHGASALGFVFWPRSPRYITPDRAAEIIAHLPPGMATVGVFVNEPVEAIRAIVARTGITTVQLHGDEPPAYAAALGAPVLRAVGVEQAAAACPAWPAGTTFLLDAADTVRRGGTGEIVDWGRAAGVARQWPVVLAGGLRADNVAEGIEIVRPCGVDVASGVEDAPGVKNMDSVARFLANARKAFEAR